MFVIPALDMIGGKTVRLEKGNFDAQTVYNSDPVTTSGELSAAGFTRLHLVDLDGARNRKITHLEILKKSAFESPLKIDFGGGVSSIEDVRMVLNAGAFQCTIGSLAVKEPSLIKEMVEEFGPEKILIGADVLDEQIKISGWLQDGDISVFDFIESIINAGVKNIFCTDILKDGMMEGPAISLYKKILERFPKLNLIASGGVRNINDLVLLKTAGCVGAVVGKAIYEENIPLNEWVNFK